MHIYGFYDECKRRYNIKTWKQFCDVFNCFPVCGLSPEISIMDQVRRLGRPMDVPDTGIIYDLLWADSDKDIAGWAENDRGVSFIFGPDVITSFLQKQDMDLAVRAHQVVEDGYEFFAKRQLITVFSAPNYYGEFDNTGVTMAIDETLMCSFKVPKALEEKIASMLTELRQLAGVVMILATVHLNFMTVTLMAYIFTLV